MTNVVFAIIIVLIILIIYQSYLQYLDYMIDWDDLCSKKQLISLFHQLGIPDVKIPGGSAIWLEDSLKQHNLQQVMANPNGTVYIFISIDLFAGLNSSSVIINDDVYRKRIKDIISFSDNVYYDDFKKQLLSKYYFLDGAKSLAVLAMKITTGELSKKTIISQNMVEDCILKLIPCMDEFDPAYNLKNEKYIAEYKKIFT